ncbi:MAG: endonuclease MutS2 [Candidatus Solibacter usitatus]|nr:endonuclease MutS2 [Candidatus Solibacter usitatus]
MNPESLALLEYQRLRDLLGRYVSSDAGRRLLSLIEPSTDRPRLEAELDHAAEALAWLDDSARPQTRAGTAPARLRFENLPDIDASSARLRIEGAVLEALEISAIAAVLERAAEVRLALAPHAARFPRLAALAASIGDFRSALREISGKILPDGSISDDASVALRRIRRDIERQRVEIRHSLERFLKAHRDDGLLQEEFVTIRNDRFVVPVVPGAKRKLPGVVHGSSGSGASLFLEPLETIDLNNDLVRLGEDEIQEVHRILREMTARLREHAHEIRLAAQTLAELDLIFAKARFAQDFDCSIPRFTNDDEPRLRLLNARHPLLQDVLRRQRKPVVPVSLTLDSSRRTLLISGPNTGGKTVAMKTVGLLALMAQSALPVPAEEAEFPIFDDVLADIGDNQSIEQSLSSFSAHVARIREMVESATSGALVLLDELGRATDPEEGGALGVAILDEFRAHGAFTLASTHLLALKVYGANTPGVLNASMGFNEETLEPTFLLRTGAPGKSAGLDIATRLGLPQRLIERARAAMSSTERDIAAFLNQLETRIGEVSTEAEELRRRQAALEARERELLSDLDKREQARLRDFQQQADVARKRFDEQAREAIESVLSSPEQRKQAEKALRQAARVKREFQESVETIARLDRPPKQAPQDEIRQGVRVRLRDVSGPARVLRVLAAGTLEVEVGFLKMQVSTADVTEVLKDAPQGFNLPKGVSFTPGPRWDTLSRELNIIGKRAEEALDEVDKFLDDCYLAGVLRARVVHGHGMGILKRTVHDLCKAHPHVEKFYPAGPSEGGNGATIIELKET